MTNENIDLLSTSWFGTIWNFTSTWQSNSVTSTTLIFHNGTTYILFEMIHSADSIEAMMAKFIWIEE